MGYITKKDVADLCNEFDVTDEDELCRKLMEEALFFTCSICGRNFNFDNVRFHDDVVICLNCSSEIVDEK
jgi:DNA-directed RNA polymerase subunit RPC12/RpoP